MKEEEVCMACSIGIRETKSYKKNLSGNTSIGTV
jgi:hypothetical protein